MKKSASEISGEMEANQAYIAAFHAGQYLSDSRCQQVMREVSRMWQGRNSAVAGLIAQFHPLTTEQLKQARDLDVYILQSIGSRLNRVHFVKKDGIAYVNPPPGDYHCESCHLRGWLWKDFQDSKPDGAVSPIWLCPQCALHSPNAKESKKDEVQRPTDKKTGIRELDENPRLFDLMRRTLELAVKEVAATGLQTPFAILETALGEMVQGFKTDRLELGYEEARRAILGAPRMAERYALAWPGYVTHEGVRYETILIEGGGRGEERGPVIGQMYKQQLPDVKYRPIGNPAIFEPHQNLLTLSSDPDAASKLRPVFARLTADRAHNHGPGHDEALTYEIKRCQEVFLDFGDLDRPFLKELQKKPDMVHVAMGRRSWITSFRPEDKEVILARDTLVPITGGQPFPGFNEDGIIAIGYAPAEPTGRTASTEFKLVVLWATMFRITDKETKEGR